MKGLQPKIDMKSPLERVALGEATYTRALHMDLRGLKACVFMDRGRIICLL